ncbi:MAG TPA: cytochrome c [Acidobacteriaceae bacterium]
MRRDVQGVLRWGTAAACLGVAAGCGPSLAPAKPLSTLTATERAGREVYVARCGGCHYPNSSAPLHGPGLFAILRNPYLPSGAPATDERVTSAILRGRNSMPAFAGTLDEEQLQQLLAYLHTL